MSRQASSDEELAAENGRQTRASRGALRRQELAATALQVFIEKGFAAATMADIAKRAGASKETLYRHFQSKQALFAEIVRARVREVTQIDDRPLPLNIPPREVLTLAGRSITGIARPYDGINFLRQFIGDIHAVPELGRIFYEQGPAVIHQRMAHYLREATVAGVLDCSTPEETAVLFQVAIIGNRMMRSILGIDDEAWSPDSAYRHVDMVVDLFLARYEKRGTHERAARGGIAEDQGTR